MQVPPKLLNSTTVLVSRVYCFVGWSGVDEKSLSFREEHGAERHR
jgi:hypothetical protein